MAEKLGVGIIGAGWVSGEHIKAYQRNPHTEVLGIVGREKAAAEQKIREHGLSRCRASTTVADLLADDHIRIVSVCTPHYLHVEQGIACAEAGRHVLMEKPAAIELAGLHALDAAIRKAGVRSLVSFVLRWNPLFDNIKALLAQGLLGSLFHGEVDYIHGLGSDIPGHRWMTREATGGSAMLVGGCHAVDALRWFVGRETVEVFAYASKSKTNRLGFEYEPNTVTVLKFDDGSTGKVGTSLEAVGPYTFPIVLFGDQGTIRNNQIFTSRWPGQRDWAAIPTVVPDSADVTHHPFIGEIDHFVDCIVGGRESHCNVADAVKTHEICLASRISFREGRPVSLPLSGAR